MEPANISEKLGPAAVEAGHGGEEDARQNVANTANQAPPEDWFAWLQVLGAFSLNLNTWGLMNAFGVFQTFYQLDLLASKTSSEISWIGSTQSFLMFLVSVFAGPIVDAGHLRPLLAVGSLLTVLGMFMTSLCTAFWQVFLAQAVAMGMGFGCLYVPAPTVVSQYFHASTALAMGASSAGSALGGIIYPIIFTHLQPRIGFGWATRVIAFIVLATLLPVLFMMKTRAAPTSKYTLLDKSAFRDTPYLLLNLGLVFGFMGFYVIFYYIQLYALQETSLSAQLQGYLLVIINASSLLGRLVPGYYADMIGSINVQMAVALVGGILTFCLVVNKNAAGLVVYCVLYGFCAGAFMGLPAAGVVSLSLEKKSMIGTRLGMTLATVGCGVLVSNPIAGAILNGRGGWIGLVVWCGVLLMASCASMAASRVAKVGFGWKGVI